MGLGLANPNPNTDAYPDPDPDPNPTPNLAISGIVSRASLLSSMPSELRSQLAKPLASSSGQVPFQSQTQELAGHMAARIALDVVVFASSHC